MSDINFSVAFQILDPLNQNGNENFKQEFKHFKNHMNKRIKEIIQAHIYGLMPIVNILKNDAVGKIDSHLFLSGMKDFVGEFYKFDEKYKQKREVAQKQLFDLGEVDDLDQTRLGYLNTNEILLK